MGKGKTQMKHSDLLRLSLLMENSDYGQLTSNELRQLLEEAGLLHGDWYQEMEMEIPFTEFWRGCGFLSGFESLHSHSYYEIIFCVQGDVRYLLGTERWSVGVGDMIVIPPGVSHRGLSCGKDAYIRYGLWVNAVHMRQLEQNFSGLALPKEEKARVFRTKGTPWEDMETYFSKGWQTTNREGALWQAEAYGEAVVLLVKISQALQELCGEEKKKTTPDLLGRILIYIDLHLSEKLTLGEMARRFFVSESYITHLFQKKVGISFYRYVTQRRLIAAKTEIEKGRPMESVGEMVGFASYSNFYRAFVKEYGIAPSRYRELCRKPV